MPVLAKGMQEILEGSAPKGYRPRAAPTVGTWFVLTSRSPACLVLQKCAPLRCQKWDKHMQQITYHLGRPHQVVHVASWQQDHELVCSLQKCAPLGH